MALYYTHSNNNIERENTMKKHIKKIFAIVAIVAVVGVGGLYVSTMMPAIANEEAVATSGVPMEYIRTTTLSKDIIQQTITTTGVVESSETISVFATMNNTEITEVLIEEGDVVTEGDVMFRMDPADLLEDIADKEEDIADQSEKTLEAYNDAYETQSEAWDAVYENDGARDQYNEWRTLYNTAVNALNHLQNEYDDAFDANQDALVHMHEMQEELDELLDEQAELLETSPSNASTDLSAEIAVAQAEYDASVAAQKDTSAAADVAEQELNEAKSLYDYNTVEQNYNTTKTTYEKALETYEDAKEKADEALEEHQSNDAMDTLVEQLEDLQENISDYEIVADLSGTITRLNVEVGEETETNVALAIIEDANTLQIVVDVDENQIGIVEVGQSAVITTDATDEELAGTVVSKSPTATSQGSGSTASSFSVTISVDSVNDDLLIGMNAQVDIIISTSGEEYVVPLSAIETEDDKSYVSYQVTDAEGNITTERIEVTLGEADSYYVQISSPELQDGMKIISDMTGTAVVSEDNEMMMMMPGMTGEMPTGGTAPTGGGGGGMAGGGRG